jgi:hypothetical protein
MVPAAARSGRVPLALTIGGAGSQSGALIWVQ